MRPRALPGRLAAIVRLRGLQQVAAAALAGDAVTATRSARDQLGQAEHGLADTAEQFRASLSGSRFDAGLISGWSAAWRQQAADVELDRARFGAAETEEQSRRLEWNNALALEQASAVALRRASVLDRRWREERWLADVAECTVAKEDRA